MKIRVRIPNRASMFAKNYRLPLWSTFGLFTVLVLLLVLRTYERSILAGVLGSELPGGRDYAALLNSDKDTELRRNPVTGEVEDPQTEPDTAEPTSLSLDSSGASTTGGGSTTTGGGGGTTTPGGGGGATNPPVPAPEPFSAQVSGFSLRSQSGAFLCDTGSILSGLNLFCKTYEFAAGVSTSNGPGSVSHVLYWKGASNGEVAGNFHAPSGDALTSVPRQIKLSCNQQGSYAFRFALITPSRQESQEILINHNCGNG